MRLLLDTHTLLWAMEDPSKLSPTAHTLVNDAANAVLLSSTTFWEVAVKVSVGKLALKQPFEAFMVQALAKLPAAILGMEIKHSAMLCTLPLHHRDPFDRMLVAQALVEQMPIVSVDAQLDAYAIDRRW
jgi:PIN domain nuclease of toxin-antitoxin system